MDLTSAFGIVTDILVALTLIFTFIGGLRQGAVKEFFGLVALVVAMLFAGLFIGIITSWFSFVGIVVWRNFLGFILTIGLIILVMYLILWLPRYYLDKIWDGGFFWSLLGGIFGLIDCALGLVLLVKLLNIYPILSWLNSVLATSHILNWLTATFGPFVTMLLQAFTGRVV